MTGKIKQEKSILNILAVFTIAMLVVHIGILYFYNNTNHTCEGYNPDEKTYMELVGREGDTSTWLKRGFDLYGKMVDLTGTIIDGTIYNNADMSLNEWTLTINIEGDCFINQAWTGEVEIHQYVNSGNEKVQTLNLQTCDKSDIELDYLYDGDILIPLKEGDRVVYYPSVQYKENAVERGSSVTVGIIFYYLNTLNLDNYQIDYRYDMKFYQGFGFVTFVILLAAFLINVIIYAAISISYKNVEREMELQKSSLSCMADIYSYTYMISIDKGEISPIQTSGELPDFHPERNDAKQQLINLFSKLSAEDYKEIVLDFINLDTVGERLKNRNSIACDYKDINDIWHRIRIFAMDHMEDEKLDKIILAIQEINEEKLEEESMQQKIHMAELDIRNKAEFIVNAVSEIDMPLKGIIAVDEELLEEAKDEKTKAYAQRIKNISGMLSFQLNNINDYAYIASGDSKLKNDRYSLDGFITRVLESVDDKIKGRGLGLITDFSYDKEINLYGDEERLKEILENLFYYACKYTQEGNISFSVYGKAHEDNMHLLFSIKDTGIGISGEDFLTKLSNLGVGMSLVIAIVKEMGSEIKVISNEKDGTEIYFEIEQKICDRQIKD